jgi:oxygen-independent coproporphyrinogen-3 oxidase
LPVKELVAFSRELHFTGINLDLIYGLPGQTEANFYDSVQMAVEAAPDRIALFSYAHVPWLKENQKLLEKYPMPNAREKMTFFLEARNAL